MDWNDYLDICIYIAIIDNIKIFNIPSNTTNIISPFPTVEITELPCYLDFSKEDRKRWRKDVVFDH